MTKVKGCPHNQPFCATPQRNLTKRRAWWQTGTSNNPQSSQRKKKDEDGSQ